MIQRQAGPPTRTYDFLASVIPCTNCEWERASIVLNLLITKLTAPKDEDLSKGILEALDMDSYRIEKKAVMRIALADNDAEIGPIPIEGGGKREPELDRLSNILKAFNDHFGTLFTDADRVACRIREDIAPKVAAAPAYQNARKNTPNSARIEHDKVLAKVMLTLLEDDTQVYKPFVENESSRHLVTDMVFRLTREGPGSRISQQARPASPSPCPDTPRRARDRKTKPPRAHSADSKQPQ